MTWAIVAVAGASIVGGAIASDGAQSAADTQAAAADKSTQLQQQVFDKQVALNDPYRRMGLGAGNRLMTLLGLSPGAASTGLDGKPVGGGVDRNALRAQLLPQFTSGGTQGASPVDAMQASGGGGTTPGTVDEAGLNAEIDKRMAAQQPDQNAGMGDPTDPAFGSLMKDFSMADYQADPGYQFRLDQGEQGLDRSAAAHGSLQSGRAMKDAMSFNSGLASQEYGKAFDRFQVNRSNKLNPLQSLMGVGQTGTNALTSAAGTFGTNAGANIIGAGNAQAAGQVGSANAINNAIGQGVSAYQGNTLMGKLFPTNAPRGSVGGGLDPSMYAG